MLDGLDADWPSLDVMTERYFDLVMDHVSRNRSRAAQILGVGRQTIARMLARRDEGGAVFHPVHRETQKKNRAGRPLRELLSPRDRIDDVLDDLLGVPEPGRVEREAAERETEPVRSVKMKAIWQDIQVWAYAAATLEALEGNRRLQALQEWRDGRGKRSVWYMQAGREIGGADEVDWTHFPGSA